MTKYIVIEIMLMHPTSAYGLTFLVCCQILKAGLTDSRPPSGSLVTVKVQGRLETGTCFQDTKETFILGDGDAIAGELFGTWSDLVI